MSNTIDGQLNVYVRDRSTDQYTLIESIDQNHGPFWLLKEITVDPQILANGTQYYTVIYEAVVGSRTGGRF